MNIDNLGGQTPAEGVSADSSAQESSPGSTIQTQQADPVKNLKAEMNRKLSKINDSLTKELQEIKNALGVKSAAPVEETVDAEPLTVTKQVDARLAKRTHEQHFKDAVKVFPELNPEGDAYDQEFYTMVDNFYTKFTKADPTDVDALQNAIELAANKSGKSQRLIQDKLLKDEARRSRIIAEGGSTPRESKKGKEPQLNNSALARLGINPDKLKERLKNKDRYGE